MKTLRFLLCLAAALGAGAAAARADDFGPRQAVHDIRHDVPILLAHWHNEPIRVENVVAVGLDAVATWYGPIHSGIVVMHRRSDRWWMRQYGIITVSTEDSRPPDIASAMHVPVSAATIFMQHIAALRDGYAAQPLPGTDCREKCGPAMHSATDFFYLTLTFTETPPVASAIFAFHGRAATQAEMPPAEGQNGLYYFDISSDVTSPKLTLSDATMDVWFPFVLDPADKYVLWLGFVEPEIQRLPGTLKDNVLHFALPPFAMPVGKSALGEIDTSIRGDHSLLSP